MDEAILENDDFSERLFNGSDAPDPYCAAVDTATLSTVVPSSTNPPPCAYRAHNKTDPSKSFTYLNIQHPDPIKLEDFPMSPAAETVPTDEHCYSTSNNAHLMLLLTFTLLLMTLTLYQVLSLNQNPWQLSLLRRNCLQLLVANIQQPARKLSPLFPDPPLQHPNPLNKIHHPFQMFQDPLHHPPLHLYFSNGTHEDPTNGPSTCATYTSAFASATPSQLSASRFSLTRQKLTRFAS
jgi:hypothetical protein